MAYNYLNRCIWLANAAGTGTFAVNAPAYNGYTPAQCVNPTAVDGGTYRYFAVNGVEHEEGNGVYNATAQSLTRVVRNSSNGGSEVSFSIPPVVYMGGPTADDLAAVQFASGTAMLFQQTTAPVGWTKSTSHNDKALRVVTGTANAGGTVVFSTVFARFQTDPHYLTIAEMPNHAHSMDSRGDISYGAGAQTTGVGLGQGIFINTYGTGGSGPHTHNMDMRVQYVDVILASKN